MKRRLWPLGFFLVLLMAGGCKETLPVGAGPDCAGAVAGFAVVDMCGVCDAEPVNDCVQDCEGTWGGVLVIDACGVCGGDGATCVDCTGTPHGGAVVDVCGVCDGDNTTCADCAGVPNGVAQVDPCGSCDVTPGNDCVQDCSGVWGGTSVVDSCGVCDGDGLSCADCAGIPNGPAVNDECGICDGDNTSCADCAGVPNGPAVNDECGVCAGDGSTCLPIFLEAVADAYIYAYGPNSNYGATEELRVDRAINETWLRFDLREVPRGATIHAVTLHMWGFTGYAWGGDGNVYTYPVEDDSWNEYTISWNTRPPFVDSTVGFWWLYYGPDDQGGPIDRAVINEDPELVPMAQNEIEGDGVISLKLSSPGFSTAYRSREFTEPTMRPALEIDYRDCHDDRQGLAYVDRCAKCVGGRTGSVPCTGEGD